MEMSDCLICIVTDDMYFFGEKYVTTPAVITIKRKTRMMRKYERE